MCHLQRQWFRGESSRLLTGKVLLLSNTLSQALLSGIQTQALLSSNQAQALPSGIQSTVIHSTALPPGTQTLILPMDTHRPDRPIRTIYHLVQAL